MKFKDYTGILPEQITGKEIAAQASTDMDTAGQALLYFYHIHHRLLSVCNWHEHAGNAGAHFQLIDGIAKQPANREAMKDDYIRIDIPGPGSVEGEGYDWVQIEEIKQLAEKDIQCVSMRVRPCANPLNEKNEVAHFYENTSTSSFIATREKTKLTVTIVDRNTKPNKQSTSLPGKLRNAAVGTTAVAFFSKIQWQHLANGLLKQSQNI